MSEEKARPYVVAYWTDAFGSWGEDHVANVDAYSAADAATQVEIKMKAAGHKVSVRGVEPERVSRLQDAREVNEKLRNTVSRLSEERDNLKNWHARLSKNAHDRMPKIERLAKDLYHEVRETMEYLDVEWTT